MCCEAPRYKRHDHRAYFSEGGGQREGEGHDDWGEGFNQATD